MGSIAVLVKHSGRWTYEKNYEEYVTDAILLSTSATFIELHDVLASHLDAQALDIFEMDTVEVIISDPYHKHVEDDQVNYTLFCKSRHCEFLMRASGIGESRMFRIRRFIPQHTCSVKDKIYTKVYATSMLIGGMVKQKFKNYKRKYSATDIRNDMKEDFCIDLTYTLCWRAKERAFEELRGKPSASYGKLPSYLYVLNTTYPESHIKMKKTDDNAFLCVFITLHAFITGFDHCRSVVMVDASHLRGIYTGVFVIACTTDGANHKFSLVYGVLDSENDASWTWFFENLKKAYGERQHMCVVSDRNPSIIKAVGDVYKDVPHYACMWHLWRNVKKLYRKSHDALSEIFYTMAKSYSKSEFLMLMEKVEAFDIRVKKYLELVGYEKWAWSYATVHRGWTLTSNITKSINGVLVSARELSIYDFLEEVRLLFAKWNYANRQEASYTFTTLIEKFNDILSEN
ncbi:hypothetical protein P3L10_015903 [Capsicum annuum]